MKPYAKYSACALAAAFVFAHGAAAQTPAPAGKNTQSLEDNFPLPVGQKSFGIRFPYEEDGKRKMYFNVDVMERRDLEHILMTNAKIETYDDNQKIDLTLLLPVSILDLKTRLLTTDKQFVLQRTDFELMGDSLELDTVARHAKITGKVRMIIYNFDEQEAKNPGHE